MGCRLPAHVLNLNPPTGLWDRRFGAGWPLGWCVCGGRRVLGRAGLGCGAGAGWWRVGLGCAAPGAVGGSDELGQVADVSQGGGEGVLPWPVERQAQFVAVAVVDEAARHGEEPVADGGRDGELPGGVGAPEAGGPAGEVVREDTAGEPGAVGEELARGAAAEPGAFFEVSDGEFDCGVVSVVGVGCFGVEVVSVGDEAVVAPVGPQLALGAEQAAAPRDEAQPWRVRRRRRAVCRRGGRLRWWSQPPGPARRGCTRSPSRRRRRWPRWLL